MVQHALSQISTGKMFSHTHALLYGHAEQHATQALHRHFLCTYCDKSAHTLAFICKPSRLCWMTCKGVLAPMTVHMFVWTLLPRESFNLCSLVSPGLIDLSMGSSLLSLYFQKCTNLSLLGGFYPYPFKTFCGRSRLVDEGSEGLRGLTPDMSDLE